MRDGQVDAAAMRRALLAQSNLQEAIRQSIGDKKVADVALAILERDGKVTVLAKE